MKNEIYTRQEFREQGHGVNDYDYNTLPGEFSAVLEMKAWGKNRNLRSFFRFDDGRKIIAPSYDWQRYCGICEIPIGSRVKLTYEERSDGVYLTRAEKADAPEPGEELTELFQQASPVCSQTTLVGETPYPDADRKEEK